MKIDDLINTVQIINIDFKIDNIQFNATIEINLQPPNQSKIEIYSIDYPEWNIFITYIELKTNFIISNNNRNNPFKYRQTTTINFDKIIEETKKWIATNIPYDDTI